MIECFAGLRTARLAAQLGGFEVRAHLSAELDDYANRFASCNFQDVRLLTDDEVAAAAQEATPVLLALAAPTLSTGAAGGWLICSGGAS